MTPRTEASWDTRLGEPIEVVPAADYERALDALERLYASSASVDVGKWEQARAVLRAAGRLDG